MLLQGLLGRLQHRLMELLGELLGREAFPGLDPAVEAGRAVLGRAGGQKQDVNPLSLE